jgi:alginate O-acetyltransferase complex protein AlgI
MLFNSLAFYLFLPIVFFLYWKVFGKKHPIQNILLLLASYIFYAWWDWRFTFLLIFSTLLDYALGFLIDKAPKQRIRFFWLATSVVINLGLLMYFKYCNFFITSLKDALNAINLSVNLSTLNIILPIGISFYTFHGLSYVFDIYRKEGKPCNNLVDYFLFVSYFPLLVAGPIERASHLLPQLQKKRHFDWAQFKDGLRLASWGFFKKVVIADTLAVFVDSTFASYANQPGIHLIIAAIFFSFQIYCDFSGYSDIARGVSKLFGIELLLNFNFPYFSQSIPEFWKKWHISLTSWFRDYLFIPLGGSRDGKFKTIRNIFIVFLVSAIWHGANYTFIVWGLIHALLYMPDFLGNNHKKYQTELIFKENRLPSLKESFNISLTFTIVTLAWIFFRSNTIHDANQFILSIVKNDFFSSFNIIQAFNLVYVIILLFIETKLLRQIKIPDFWYFAMFLLATLIILNGDKPSFLYFQF